MKNTKNIVLVSIIILVAVAFLVVGKTKNTSENEVLVNSGEVQISSGSFKNLPSEYDFGNVPIRGGKVMHVFELKNGGDSEIVVTQAATSCMCTEAELILGEETWGPFGMYGHGVIPKINVPIPPGETLNVKAIFDPAAHGPAGIGPVKRNVMLQTNQGDFVIGFKAMVTP